MPRITFIFLLLVSLGLMASGYAIDNGGVSALPEPIQTAVTGAETVIDAALAVPIPAAAAPRVVVVPNGNHQPPVVPIAPIAPYVVAAPAIVAASPTITAYVPPVQPTIAVTVTEPTIEVITVTATLEPAPIIVTATPNQKMLQPEQSTVGCTTSLLGIGCGAAVLTATPLPTALPNLDAHGMGGAHPPMPTAQAVQVIAPEEVAVPDWSIYTILETEMWGDLTVRSTWDGQQVGTVCYSAKYDGQLVTCPPSDQLEEWKVTHQVTFPAP